MARFCRVFVPLLVAVGCDGDRDPAPWGDSGEATSDTGPASDTGPGEVDADADGYPAGEGRRDDCDDANPEVHPGATEHCDGIDEDCDGEVDDDALDADTWYRDIDGDGYAGSTPTEACTSPGDGWSLDQADCDDGDPAVNPAAEELPCTGSDDDCDGSYGAGAALGADGTRYDTLGAAITAATAGDTLTLCEGTLDENVVVDVPLSIVALDGAVIDGGGRDSVLVVEADLVVTGATFQGGAARFGGLVYVEGGVLLALVDSRLYDGQADSGGCVWIGSGARVTATGVDIRYCEAENTGGAVMVGTDATLELSRAAIRDGASLGEGGGLWLGEGAALTLVESEISASQADDGGGLFAAGNNTCAADASSLVSGNRAEYGGGLYVAGAVAWTGGVFSGNRAATGGGGVFVADDVSFGAADWVVTANTAAVGAGIDAWGAVALQSCEITDNDGNGLHLLGGSAIVDSCRVTGNSAAWGGGAYLYGSTLQSIDSDWGTGATDNAPDDVYIFANGDNHSFTGYGEGANFSCDEDCSE